MSEKSNVPLFLTMDHLNWYCDLSKYAILSCRRQFFDSIDILHMHTSFFILNIFIK